MITLHSTSISPIVKFTVRYHSRGWVDDSDDKRVKAVSDRVAAITGLDIQSAESFQVHIIYI